MQPVTLGDVERNFVGLFCILGFLVGACVSFVWWGFFVAIFGMYFFFTGLAGALIGVFLGAIVARRV